MQGNNLDDALIARGLTTGAKLYRDYDLNYSGGGPLIKDRLWFYVSGRNFAYNNYVAGAFNPDGSQAIDDNNREGVSGAADHGRSTRRTASPRCSTGPTRSAAIAISRRTSTPDGGIQQAQPAEHILQGKWTSTLTSHLLFETGYTQSYNAPLYTYQPEVPIDTCHTVYTACAPGSYGSIAHQDTVLGTQYVASLPGPVSGYGTGVHAGAVARRTGVALVRYRRARNLSAACSIAGATRKRHPPTTSTAI